MFSMSILFSENSFHLNFVLQVWLSFENIQMGEGGCFKMVSDHLSILGGSKADPKFRNRKFTVECVWFGLAVLSCRDEEYIMIND